MSHRTSCCLVSDALLLGLMPWRAQTYPMIDPTVHVRPYKAKASVELDSSVMSPSAARTTATFPHSAPDRHRTMIIIQKLVERPLSRQT